VAGSELPRKLFVLFHIVHIIVDSTVLRLYCSLNRIKTFLLNWQNDEQIWKLFWKP